MLRVGTTALDGPPVPLPLGQIYRVRPRVKKPTRAMPIQVMATAISETNWLENEPAAMAVRGMAEPRMIAR